MKKSVLILALLASASTARAEWADLTGSEAPSFDVKKWFNQAEGASVADLRGKLILLEFWATW